MSSRWAARRELLGDEGNAVVEFCALGVLLLVPLVYLVLALARIESGALAAQRAAREAGRAFVTAATDQEGHLRAQQAGTLAFADQGLAAEGVVEVHCAGTGCLAPGARVRTTAQVAVVLPGVPRAFDAVVPLRVVLTAEQVTAVDEFRVAP